MSYLSNNSNVQGLQLSVQSLVVKKGDVAVVSTVSNSATIELYQPIKEIRAALFIDDSAGTIAPVALADRTVNDTEVTLDLGVALADDDAIILEYVIAQP